MKIILVRHGQSVANAERRMQGHKDYPLNELGETQALAVGRWLKERGIVWQAAQVSPLQRAKRTYEIIAQENAPAPHEYDMDLREIHAGDLQGLTVDEISAQFPAFLTRDVTELGDFSLTGGEAYAEVQARVQRLLGKWQGAHKAAAETLLVVTHGGLLYQLVKAAICIPVPKVAILRYGNCSATQLFFREHRGTYMAEVSWHVPVELMVPFAAGEALASKGGVRGIF